MEGREPDRPAAASPDVLAGYAARVGLLSRRPQLDAAAAVVIGAFADAGIDSVLLKGPVLARLLYRAGEHRAYSDIDLLVSPRKLLDARTVLDGLGYANTSAQKGIHDLANVLHSETWAAPSGPVTIDLHWRLAGCEADPQAAWQILFSRRAFLKLEGRPVPVLDRAGVAMHLATHLAQGEPGDHKARADLALGLERLPDEVWRAAAKLASELEGATAFAAGLRLVPQGAALADDLKLPATAATEWQIAHRAERPRGTFHLDALLGAEGLRERAAIVGRSLFPTRLWIAWNTPWVGHSRLRIAAAYALHLARSPLWAIRAGWFRRRGRRRS